MRIRGFFSLVGTGLAVGSVSALAITPGVMAQPLESKTPPVKREPPPPAVPDRDLRPTPPPVPHTPGFLAPLSRPTKSGRAGIAGWTAPNAAVGARGAVDAESSGVFGFGAAAEWGRSIPPRDVTPPEAASRSGGPRASLPPARVPPSTGRMDGGGVDDSADVR
jgi:hypothetical protein